MVSNLFEVIHRLRDHGNTIVVIEHNLASSRPPTGLLTWDRRVAGLALGQARKAPGSQI